MANKQQKPKEDSNIPMSIMGLSSGKKSPSITKLAKKVNDQVVGGSQENRENKQETKTQTEEEQNNAQNYVHGRYKKSREKLTKAMHDNEWDNFLDYVTQYNEKGCEIETVTLDVEIKKCFARMKSSMKKSDVQSLVSAALRIFIEKHRDKIIEMMTFDL